MCVCCHVLESTPLPSSLGRLVWLMVTKLHHMATVAAAKASAHVFGVCCRQTAAGDQLRITYEQLSKDPNSLSNLDQDLPNYAQHSVPIHSLPMVCYSCPPPPLLHPMASTPIDSPQVTLCLLLFGCPPHLYSALASTLHHRKLSQSYDP